MNNNEYFVIQKPNHCGASDHMMLHDHLFYESTFFQGSMDVYYNFMITHLSHFLSQ